MVWYVSVCMGMIGSSFELMLKAYSHSPCACCSCHHHPWVTFSVLATPHVLHPSAVSLPAVQLLAPSTCMCIWVRMYACMYVCMYVVRFPSFSFSRHLRACAHVYVCMYVVSFPPFSSPRYLHVCARVRTYVCGSITVHPYCGFTFSR
jgi:hypothetical protein